MRHTSNEIWYAEQRDLAVAARDDWKARAERAEAEAEALRAQLDTAQEAAHMPDDWPHGLPSWIAQRLYAAYIGIGMASSARRMRRWTS